MVFVRDGDRLHREFPVFSLRLKNACGDSRLFSVSSGFQLHAHFVQRSLAFLAMCFFLLWCVFFSLLKSIWSAAQAPLNWYYTEYSDELSLRAKNTTNSGKMERRANVEQENEIKIRAQSMHSATTDSTHSTCKNQTIRHSGDEHCKITLLWINS